MVVARVATSSRLRHTGVAADAAGDTAVPYAGVDFRGDPDMVLPPGEVFDHRGMFMSLIYIF
jgi:hypothetical protein